MKTIRFFKAKSRLGLINPPYRSTDMNVGVEDAPDAILSPEFLAQFHHAPTVSYDFPKPEEIDKEQYQDIIATSSIVFAQLISVNLKPGETQVTIGGDHSITFATLLALQNRFDLSEIGYIQIDSHADIHLFKTSPTGNFHGIYVRPFVDELDSQPINSLVKTRLLPQNMLYIGNLDIEEEEQRFLKAKHIPVYSREDIITNKQLVLSKVHKYIKRLKHIHVSFDIDAFDHTEVSATGIPAPHGIFLKEIIPFLALLSHSPSLSIDLVEINPKKNAPEKSIEIARQVLINLLN